MEGVQRRFTRLIPGMSGLSYKERLSRLGLYSLKFRRVRGDLTETYKILTVKQGRFRKNVPNSGGVQNQGVIV